MEMPVVYLRASADDLFHVVTATLSPVELCRPEEEEEEFFNHYKNSYICKSALGCYSAPLGVTKNK